MNVHRTSAARAASRAGHERLSKRLDALAVRAGVYVNSEKIARMRQWYFGDVDALQKSGTVKLPK